MKKTKKNFYEKGMKEFKFNYQVEMKKYKSLICSGNEKENEKFIKKYNKKVIETNGEELVIPKTYTEWEKQIEEKYGTYTEDELRNFLFYLESGTNRRRGVKEVTNITAMPFLASVLSLGVGSILEKMQYGIVGYVIGFIALVIVFVTYIWNVDKLFFEYDEYEKFYMAYSKIIDRLCKGKSKND